MIPEMSRDEVVRSLEEECARLRLALWLRRWSSVAAIWLVVIAVVGTVLVEAWCLYPFFARGR